MENGILVERISYPQNVRQSVEQTVAIWQNFCALPESTKIKFPYNSNNGMGVGYELKKTSGANLDVKEDFHFAPGAEQWILDTAKSLDNPEVSHFVETAKGLVEIVEPLVLNFANHAEKEFGLKDLAKDTADAKPQWFIRFLHYFGNRKDGDEIATPHADKSGFTLHLYESDPGLQYLDAKKQWQDMPVSPNETVIIPGMRFQYRSRGNIKAVYHRVIANEKTAREGRYSIVCFVHFTRTPAYDKQRAGRLQEFQPGFNYEMPFEEFARLFK